MNIYTNKCLELNFLLPLESESQEDYILRLISSGLTINTRQARVIGIGDLHSVSPSLRAKGYDFIDVKRKAIDPVNGETPEQEVIHLSMTTEQRKLFKEDKATAKAKRKEGEKPTKG